MPHIVLRALAADHVAADAARVRLLVAAVAHVKVADGQLAVVLVLGREETEERRLGGAPIAHVQIVACAVGRAILQMEGARRAVGRAHRAARLLTYTALLPCVQGDVPVVNGSNVVSATSMELTMEIMVMEQRRG